MRAGGSEDALHASARVGRPAPTCTGMPVPEIDHADAWKPVGVRVLPRLDHIGDDKRLELLGGDLESPSSSSPTCVSVSKICSADASVFEVVLRQERVNFHRA